jgi:hypothetical protein
MRVVLREQVGRFFSLSSIGWRRKLLVRDHLAEIGDVFLDAGDLLRPGGEALVWDSGSVLSLCFGERDEGVFQFLLKCGAGHGERLSLKRVERLGSSGYIPPSA